MKFGLIVLSLVASSGYAFVSQQSKWTRPSSPVSSTLMMATPTHHQHTGDWWQVAPAAMAIAGWAVAAQVSFAAAPMELAQPMSQDKQAIEEIAPTSYAAYSNLLLSARVETLDFSMPSYDAGGSSSAPKVGENKPPAFTNPFSDISLPSPSDSSTTTDDKADEKAAAAAEKKAAKEAAEAKKAEEKAAKEAAEAKKAEEKAAKEARRKEQMELQKAAVERAKQKDTEAEGTAAPALSVPDFKAPEMPDVKLEMPDMKMPSFKAPEVPEFKAPDFSGFSAPKIPEFKAPDLKVPEGFKAPSIPEFKAPDSFKAPQAPSFDVPKAPSFDSKIEMPKFGLPLPSLDGGTTTSEGEVLESQEARDEKAREARSVFLVADDEAKVIEKQARELRNIANDKKKVAKAAKDEACKTRWGGKFICLRPFGSGY